jgi:regulator of replication initiation timing
LSETAVTQLQEQVKTLFANIGEIKADVKELKEQFANRLPLWATMLIGILMAVCGWFAGH